MNEDHEVKMKGALKNPPEWTAVGSPWPWTSSPTKQHGGLPWWPARTIAERTDPETPAVGAGSNGPTVTAALIRHISRRCPVCTMCLGVPLLTTPHCRRD